MGSTHIRIRTQFWIAPDLEFVKAPNWGVASLRRVLCGWPALVGWRFLCVCAFDGFLLWVRIAYACPTIASLCNTEFVKVKWNIRRFHAALACAAQLLTWQCQHCKIQCSVATSGSMPLIRNREYCTSFTLIDSAAAGPTSNSDCLKSLGLHMNRRAKVEFHCMCFQCKAGGVKRCATCCAASCDSLSLACASSHCPKRTCLQSHHLSKSFQI